MFVIYVFFFFFFFGGGGMVKGVGSGSRFSTTGGVTYFCDATSPWKRDVLHGMDYHTATPSISLVLL